jgi:hypothetical protein
MLQAEATGIAAPSEKTRMGAEKSGELQVPSYVVRKEL